MGYEPAAGVRLRLSWRSRFILRRALGLNGLSNKSPVRLHFAFYQALRAILERVGERIGAHIADGKTLALLDQHKIDAAGIVLDRFLVGEFYC